MKNITLPANKSEGTKSLSLIYRNILITIQERAERKGNIIPFPEIFKILSWRHHLKKNEGWEVLEELKKAGVIEVKPYHGVVLISH